MAGQGSARVTLREIDLSQVRNPQQSPQGVPAAVVGTARKGPAFVPRTFANIKQFDEVFGSMLEVGKYSNSNLPGPLALNEWMKSAQAGTFLRVLGVGNGLKADTAAATLNKVTDAGFVVGNKLVQKQSNGSIGKVGDNPHAVTDDSNAAVAVAKTHFLGCFMKDASGSTFLQDAGIQQDDASGSLTLNIKTLPAVGDTFVFRGIQADNQTQKTFTFTIAGGADGSINYGDVNNGNITINVGDNPALSAVDFAARLAYALNGQNKTNNAAAEALAETSLYFTATPSADPEDATVGVVVISQEGSGDGSNLQATLNVNSDNPDLASNANGDSISSSLTEQSVRDTIFSNDATAPNSFLTVNAFPDNETIIVLRDLLGNTASLKILTNETSALALEDATPGEMKIGIKNLEPIGPDAENPDPDNPTDVELEAITSAIKDALDSIIAADQGAFQDFANGNSINITIEQDANNGNRNTRIGIVSALKGSTLQSRGLPGLVSSRSNNNPSTKIVGGNGVGHNGQAIPSSVTLSFTGAPDVDNEFTISKVNENTAATTTHTFKFIDDAGGELTGVADAEDDKIQIELSDDLGVLLSRVQSAIERSTIGGNFTTQVDYNLNSIKISRSPIGDNPEVLAFLKDQDFVFQLSRNVTVSGIIEDVNGVFNVASDVQGLFGPQSIQFVGGGGGASAIIRGVLMMPQGVRPALAVNSGLNAGSFAEYDDTNTRSAAYGKSFGSTDGTDLTGYLVGKVDTSSQGFDLLLNGYSNLDNPAKISCSFDPDSDSYFAKVLNTDPTRIEELGHYLYAHWDVDSNVAIPSNSGLTHGGAQLSGAYADMIGFVMQGEGDGSSLPDYDSFEQRFQTAKTPWIVSQFSSVSDNTSPRPRSAAEGGAKKLFRLHALDDGAVGNTQFRLLVSDLRYNGENDYGTFTLSLEKFDSDPVKGETLISWKKADLNPDSSNFIGRLIGDEHKYYDFDADADKQRIKTRGSYALKNSYVRIELSDELKQGLVPPSALPSGFQGHSYVRTALTDNFLEQSTIENDKAKRVFTDVNNDATSVLSSAQVLPLDYVNSISRLISGSVEEADSDLPWGVKLSYRENDHTKKKELVEQVFNKSIKSWTKFFPSIGQNPTLGSGDSADTFQESLFSLEKILIPDTSVDASSKRILNWDGSLYKRGSYDPIVGNERFVTISEDAKGSNVKYLKFRCLFQGGFDGVNIFDEEKAELTSLASLREGQDEGGAKKFTGPTVMAYRRAIDVLADKSAAEFQLLSVPGQRASQVTDYAINACEERFDALLVMDIVEKSAESYDIESLDVRPHVRNTISEFEERTLDTSFAAAYFPDIVMRRPSDDAPVIMPPSVGMMGVMSRNDSIADPWFAPAGLNRGRLGAIATQVQMNRDLLDELYDADINPIYVPAGRDQEVYAFGQKTLLQDASALDRINVRRLLIDIRRKVKKVGEQLLFEPNRESTLAKFSSLVEPIMADVQQRRGVVRYKVQIDTTTTTQSDVENNTIRGKIYLQPTKSVEFISLDFVVANNIQ